MCLVLNIVLYYFHVKQQTCNVALGLCQCGRKSPSRLVLEVIGVQKVTELNLYSRTANFLVCGLGKLIY